MDIALSKRLLSLPPYLFVELDRKKAEAVKRGIDVIDLGIGDPDIPTPQFIVERMKQAVEYSPYHRYPSSNGMKSFREAAAFFMKRRFSVELDPDREITSIIGSKEAIFHLPLAFLDHDDIALVPSPGYPVYHIGTLFAGGKTYYLPLLEENNFLPDLNSIPEDVLRRARILWLNYPNNPTAGLATKEFFKDVVEFAQRHNIVVCHDAAYSEICFDGYSAPSFLEVDGAMEVGVEFHSLSKTYNMTGWRIGFVAGNEKIVNALKTVKSNADSGQFEAIQDAAIAALTSDQTCVKKMCAIYAQRRDALAASLRSAGLKPSVPKATFYVWFRAPDGHSSQSFASFLLEEAGIVATPGNGFGGPGEGFVRMALTVSVERMKEVGERLKRVLCR